ncbi:hypothetical protein [Alteraurantiacibacter buctensis]|uniref:DUF2336 domain-containing protein n=1 Tax=Alteraurantiacibacter buctensis TaxID=1503981 RepID=A0A844YYM1_9SPHN|nr:hypothetical protein [Alteraurantiacibacter buctensis]MXO72272.1 hypothetical protein [Alteraurantiacibacter buctensis]
MIQQGQIPTGADAVEQVMRDELAEGDGVLAAARPILAMLLNNRDQALFSDEVIARVRGMIAHVARQLLVACGEAAGDADPSNMVEQANEGLTQMLLGDAAILAHSHALTQEFALAEQLQRRSGIDGVLSPLLQELAASSDADLAGGAMRAIAAQARFLQQMRRMELPLGELPGDLFHKALLLLQNHFADDDVAIAAGAALRAGFDEGEGRIGQLSRLVSALGPRATRALAIDHAGPALFATALGMASNQERNLVLLSFSENQLGRLALSLRAAGLGQSAVEEQFLYLHPDAVLPAGFDMLTPARAAALLAEAPVEQAI